MKELTKMQSAIDYIVESKWTNKCIDSFGNNIRMGLDLEEVQFIYRLTIFIGKAQVYADKREIDNFRLTVGAFWNVFTEEFNLRDFEDFFELNKDNDAYKSEFS